MIADHDLVFGRCRNKEPHSSGILLCRVVVVGYENMMLVNQPSESANTKEVRKKGGLKENNACECD